MKRNAGLLLRVTGLGCLLLLTPRCSQPNPDSTTGVGGATGSAGTTGGEGGKTGTGGATGGGGATGTGGGPGAAVGGSSGTAGATGTGGRVGGTGGEGTAGVGGATGAGGAALNINDIVPGLDGFYWEASPSGNTSTTGTTNYPFGAPAGGCPTGATWDTTGYINNRTMTVGGTPGQKYTININVRGVAGSRCYTGGTPASTATAVETGPNNTWYVGGRQFNNSIWNTYEIHVAPAVPNAANVYFANSFQNVGTWCEREATYEVGYNASFPVLGGGTITFTIHDSNCRTLQNCGPTLNQAVCDTSPTTGSRIINMSGVSPAPTNFSQPRSASLGGSTYYVQWLWFDVTSVTSP